MMDYYGSITKTNESIKEDLVKYFSMPRMPPAHTMSYTTPRGTFSGYSAEYIGSIIERLGVCNENYSVSGWNVFQLPKWIRKFEDQIIEDTENANKTLLLVKIAIEHPSFPEDMGIATQIASHLRG